MCQQVAFIMDQVNDKAGEIRESLLIRSRSSVGKKQADKVYSDMKVYKKALGLKDKTEPNPKTPEVKEEIAIQN